MNFLKINLVGRVVKMIELGNPIIARRTLFNLQRHMYKQSMLDEFGFFAIDDFQFVEVVKIETVKRVEKITYVWESV